MVKPSLVTRTHMNFFRLVTLVVFVLHESVFVCLRVCELIYVWCVSCCWLLLPHPYVRHTKDVDIDVESVPIVRMGSLAALTSTGDALSELWLAALERVPERAIPSVVQAGSDCKLSEPQRELAAGRFLRAATNRAQQPPAAAAADEGKYKPRAAPPLCDQHTHAPALERSPLWV